MTIEEINTWRVALSQAQNGIDKATRLLNAIEVGKAVPFGLDQEDASNLFDTPPDVAAAQFQNLIGTVQTVLDGLTPNLDILKTAVATGTVAVGTVSTTKVAP